MCENGSICPYSVPSPIYSFFGVGVGHFPLKAVCLECRKGHLGGQKGQMVNLGSQTPKQPKCPENRGKMHKTAIWLHHID